MPLFYTDSLSLVCINVQAEKQWWFAAFDCKETKIPADWDCQLPSDVALKLPGADGPTILLSDRAEVQRAGYDRTNDHPVVFCTNPKKGQEHLRGKNVIVGPIQDRSGPQLFEIRDAEGNIIEVCKEP
jgi:hypothetical protein